MRRGIVPLVLSGCLAAATIVAAAPQSAPDTKAQSALPPPMVFYVAHGEPGACGPGCQDWIAAEGFIDRNAEPRLWELLRKIGNDRKLPVYFQSNGGSLAAGLEIGRLLRARGLAAGVGVTVPAQCDQRNPGDAACNALKLSGGELAAALHTVVGVCASSCVYTVLGGVVRDIGAGAQLGVHDAFLAPVIRSVDESGRPVDRPQVVSAARERSALEHGQKAIATYLTQMGISPDLLTAAHAVSSDQLRVLTRAEIVAFGIDHREMVESTWSLVDEPPGLSAVKLVESKDAGSLRTAMLRLTCRDATTVRLQYMHKIGADNESSPALRVTAGERSFSLTRLAGAAQGENRPRTERLGAEMPLAALAAAAFVIEASATSGQSADSPAEPSARLTVQAAAPALGALAQRCASGAR